MKTTYGQTYVLDVKLKLTLKWFSSKYFIMCLVVLFEIISCYAIKKESMFLNSYTVYNITYNFGLT
jgi:hypothetical protein